MPNLKVPSPAHLSLMCRATPEQVMRAQLSLLKSAPNFSYQSLYKTMRGLLGTVGSEEDLRKAICSCKLRSDVKEKYLELVPLISEYFSGKKVKYSLEVAPRFYSVARDLQVPFTPPLIYADEKGLCLPLFIFWKRSGLKGERLSLYASIVREILNQDPDLSEARLEIVDMSVDDSEETLNRRLRVISEDGVAPIGSKRKIEMLTVFAEGFRRARVVAAGMPPKKKKEKTESDVHPAQISLL